MTLESYNSEEEDVFVLEIGLSNEKISIFDVPLES
jgi:hypothetical protein